MKRGSLKRLVSCILALVLAFSPVLPNGAAIEAKAAEPTVWYHVESGSGNGTNHDAADSAAALLHKTEKMSADGGTFTVTFRRQDSAAGSDIGFFHTYIDKNNWLYVGYDNAGWYYRYMYRGELKGNQYAADKKSRLGALSGVGENAYVTISLALSRETMVVKVDDTKVAVTQQDFISLAGMANGAGRFGFRIGGGAAFRFKDARLNNQPLSSEWEMATNADGQMANEESVPVYEVRGTVQDKESASPIAGATMRIGADNVKTGQDGSFALAVENGTYEAVVSAKGYVAQVVSGITVNGAEVTLPSSVQLEKKTAVSYNNWIESGNLKAAVSETFPQVYQYKYKADGSEKTVDAQETALSVIKINGVEIVPVLDKVQVNADHAIYQMTLNQSGIDLKMTVKISVADNHLTWEATEIKKGPDCVKINTIEVPKLNLVTITEGQSDAQFMGATISGNVNDSGDDLRTFEDGFYANASKRYAYGFLSADGVSAGVWSNSEMGSDNRLKRNNGLNSMSLTSAEWYYDYNNESSFNFSEQPTVYEGVANGVPVSDLPCVKVCFAGDTNKDGLVDWQDGAIAYRDIMNNPYGSENTKDLVNYRISMNFSSQATNPYLKVADNIKKVYLATDGLPQAVMMKGYGSEGHDSANSEYGNIAERLGGLEDLKKLNAIAHKYHTQTGIHINAQEAYPEAQSFSDQLIQGPGSKGWGWLDQSFTIDRAYDLGSGLRFKRLLQLYDQLNGTSLYANPWPGVVGEGEDETVAAPNVIAETVAANKGAANNLDFMYLDVWYGDSWETRKIAKQFNTLGWRFSTEFGYEGEYDSTWQHWATEGHYGGAAMKGINSDVIRFIRNHQKDSFVLNWPSYHGAADNPLLGGFDLGGFEGWGSNNNFDSYITKTFAINLPTKFLQHYKVYKWENYEGDTSPTGNHEKQITLKSDDGAETVVVTRNEAQRQDDYVERTITLNGRKILDDVKYLLPWTDSDNGEEKLYHYNYDGGTTTWDLPQGWTNLANVKVYTLTDAGRTDCKTVRVSGGKITLQAEKDTPYVVLKGTSATLKTVEEWSNDAHVADTGFNSYAGTGEGSVLDGNVWTGDITDARVVRVKSGNKYLRMGNEHGKQTIATKITDLKPGTNYVAQVYVDNRSDAKAWIKVIGGTKAVSNYTLKSLAQNYPRCDAHNINAVEGSMMQTMLVSFTAKDKNATLILEREAGKGVTYFDDIRIVEKTLDNFKADGSFEQDFESVVGGLYPFVMGPAQGVDDQVTHLSERHDPYTQSGWGNIILDDVIGGNWSLKHHGSNNGIIYRTIPQNLHLEENALYEISFDYQAGWENSYYVVAGDGEDVTWMSDWMDKTAAEQKGQKSVTKRYTFTMTASKSGQSWFGIASQGVPIPSGQEKSYGQTDFILDNLKVRKVGAALSPSSASVTSAKDPVELEVAFDSELDNRNAVTWTSSDPDIVRLVVDPQDNKKCKAYFTGFGDAEVSAATTIGFEEITLKSKLSFTENFELDEKDQKTAKWKGVWANTESAGDQDYAANAIDGSVGTQWHSDWAAGFQVSESNPALITVLIEDGDSISNYNRVTILQRSNNVNGLVQKYKCVVGDNYNPQTHEITGNVSSTDVITASKTGQGEKEICVLPSGAKGKYLQIQVMQGQNGHASIAEIMLDKVGSNNTPAENANMTANAEIWNTGVKAALASVLAEAKTVYDAGAGEYSEASWAAFETAYQAAVAGAGGTDANALAELHQTLVNAQNGLVVKEADARQKLNEEITKANAIGTTNSGGYTAESWNAYMDAYQAASAGTDLTDPAQLVRLQQALSKAMENLQTGAQKAQKDLKAALDAAKVVKDAGKGDYTAESWNAFTDAYAAAEAGQSLTDVTKLNDLLVSLENAQHSFRTNAQEQKERLGLALKAAEERILMGQGDFEAGSWNAFINAYGNAFASLNSGTGNIGALYDALLKAESQLETNVKFTQRMLTAALTSAAGIKNAGQRNYTTESWNAFLAAYEAAEAGKNSNDLDLLLKLQKALADAQKGLVEAPAGGLKLTEYTDAKTGMKYKVTSIDKKTVKLVKAKDKATVKIPATVTFEGVKCTVTAIGSKAFKNCRKLKTVTLGNNIKTIEANAFYNCKRLNKINVGKKLNKVNKKAFKKCSTKKISVKLPKNLKKNKKLKNQLVKAGIKKSKIK